jgi:hypothetical protein
VKRELRIYQVAPGKMDEWLRLFQAKVVPLHEKAKLHVRAGWRDDEKNQFVWIRDLGTDAEIETLTDAIIAIPDFVAQCQVLGITVLETRKLGDVLPFRF